MYLLIIIRSQKIQLLFSLIFYESNNFLSILKFYFCILMTETPCLLQQRLLLKTGHLQQQFNRFLNQQELIKSKNSTLIEYKNICSEISIKNDQKRRQLQNQLKNLKRLQQKDMSESSINLHKSSISLHKFTKLATHSSHSVFRISKNTSHRSAVSTTWQTPSVVDINQRIFVQNMTNQSLKLELDAEKHTVVKTKLRVKAMQEKAKLLLRKSHHYRNVQSISNSQKIYSQFCISKAQKQYYDLIKTEAKQKSQFEKFSKHLKLSQDKLRKQYVKMEIKKQDLEKTNSAKLLELKKLDKPTNPENSELMISIVSSIQEIVDLLSKNESCYKELVLESCPKPRFRLRQTVQMPQPKRKQIIMINEFEQKNQFKVQSSDKFILNIFRKLKLEQKNRVIEFDELVLQRKQLGEELRDLKAKLQHMKAVMQTDKVDVTDETVNDLQKQHTEQIEMDNLLTGFQMRSNFYMNLFQFLRNNLYRFQNFLYFLKKQCSEKDCQALYQALKNFNSKYAYITKDSTAKSINDTESLTLLFQKTFPFTQPQEIAIAVEIIQSDHRRNIFPFNQMFPLIMKSLGPETDLLTFIEALITKMQQQVNEDIKDTLDLYIRSYRLIRTKCLHSVIHNQKVPAVSNPPANIKHKENNYYSQFLSCESDEHPKFKVTSNIYEIDKSEKNKKTEQEFTEEVVKMLLEVSRKPIGTLFSEIEQKKKIQEKNKMFRRRKSIEQKIRPKTSQYLKKY